MKNLYHGSEKIPKVDRTVAWKNITTNELESAKHLRDKVP